MEKKAKRSKLFYQYLFSYLLILLIPLMIMVFFVYSYIFDILREEIYMNNRNGLQKTKSTIEAHLQNITSLEHKYYLQNAIGTLSLKEDTIEAMEIQDELHGYLQLAPFIYDVLYYQEDDDYVITAGSSCRKEFLFDSLYQYENWDFETFLKDLEENDGCFFKEEQMVRVANRENRKLVTLVIPLNIVNKRCILYLIDSSFFTSAMHLANPEKEVFAIEDDNGQIIMSVGNCDLMQDKNVFIAQDSLDKVETVQIQGEKYLVTSEYSQAYNWNYKSMVLESGINSKMILVRLMMIVMCLFTCAVGVIGITFFMRRNYIPIQSLESISNEIVSNVENRNEIDHVKWVLGYLHKQNMKQKMDIELRNGAAKEQFITRWLTGYYKSEEQIQEKGKEVGLLLDKAQYVVAIFLMHNSIEGRENRLEENLIAAKPEGVAVYLKIQPEVRRILVILGFDKPEMGNEETVSKETADNGAVIKRYLCEAVSILEHEGEMPLGGIWGVGRFTTRLTQLYDSYKEANKALEYRVLLYDNKVIDFEEILLMKNCTFEVQPMDLKIFIKNKDIEGLKNFLDLALEEMKLKKASISALHMQCNNFIYALEKVIETMNRDFFLDNPVKYDISKLLQYDNIREFMEIIYLIGCDVIEQLNELSKRTIIEDLMIYIEENCYSADFSITAMAEEFNMSFSYLSLYFKRYMTKNLSDYVTELRVGKAKELLSRTDMPVKDIAEQVGYVNVNSFNRRFKQVLNCTPSEWRARKYW